MHETINLFRNSDINTLAAVHLYKGLWAEMSESKTIFGKRKIRPSAKLEEADFPIATIDCLNIGSEYYEKICR
jgi:hypothetical protein